MKKWIILTLLFGMIQLVTAAENCEGRLDNASTCLMLTPSINCANYTYDILNQSGGLVVNKGTLINLEGGIYYFNFTQETGDYLVRLCDNSTREIRVTDTLDRIIGTGRMEIAIMMIFGILISLFAYLTVVFEREWLKALFGYTTLGFTLLAINLARLFAVSHAADANIIKMLTTAYATLLWITLLLAFIGFIWLLMWSIGKLKHSYKANKRTETGEFKF